MSVADHDLEETDKDLCREHWSYRPCKACKRQADVEKAEAKKEE